MLTPVRAIRAKCLDCCSDQPSEVRLCPSTDCPLWPYRMGNNPNRKGIGGKFLENDPIPPDIPMEYLEAGGTL